MARWDRRTRLTAALGLRDETKRGLASASRGFQGYLSGMSRNTGMAGMAVTGALSGNAAFAAAGMGAAFAGFAGSAISEFIMLEKKWAEVTTLMPTLHKEALDKMKGQIDEFARESGTTLADAYNATYQAVSAGVDPTRTKEFLEVAHMAAAAGVTDLTTSVNGLTNALNAYGLETTETLKLSDDMFTAVRLGKTTFGEMAASLGMVMPIASSLNTEFQELTAASAALTAAGNTQAMAATQIRSALVALAKDTEARNLFESVTGMTYPEFQQQGGTLQEALKIIVDEANRLGVDIPKAFGRVEATTAALVLAGEGAEIFNQGMANTVGATEEAFKVMSETTDYRLNIIKSQWENFKVTTGKVFTDTGKGFLGYVHDMQSIWGGHTIAEKEAMKVSEENWRRYGRNQQAIFDHIAQGRRNILARELAGGFQPGPVPGVPTAPPHIQTGPGSVGEWLFGVSGMGAGGGDVWALGDMNRRFNDVLLGNIRETYATYGGGGGGGGRLEGAVRENTEALRLLRMMMEEELEEQRKWQTRPADAPVMPEWLQASDARFDSRRVTNALAGGRL